MPSIDTLLHWEGPRYGTLGPTGRRLFTERLESSLGIRGQFSYIHYAEIRDPIRLSIVNGGMPLPVRMVREDWYPSHNVVQLQVGPLKAIEHKFITDDDTLVEQLSLTNDSADPLACDVLLSSGFAGQLDRGPSTFTTVDLADVANRDPSPGYDIFTGRASATFKAWYEAEWTVNQFGAKGVDHQAAASGGRVLGAGFGTSGRHYAVFNFATPSIEEAHLYLRVARQVLPGSSHPSEAEWDLSLDGKLVERLTVPPTGGWGAKDSEFRWIHVAIGGLHAGGHTLGLEAVRGFCTTSFDGFYVTEAEFSPPAAVSDGRLAADSIQQVPYRPARQMLNGVPFQFIDPARNGGRGIILARPPVEGGQQHPDTEFIIPVPDNGAQLIHFCGQIAGNLDPTRRSSPVAEYELQFDDGSTERILLTPENGVTDVWNGPNVLSHRLPDDRHLVNVIFRSLGYRGNAVLAAITLETFPESGPNYHLVGSGLFYGVRAHAVMTASGFEPHPDRPAMVRRLRLAPGESTRLNLAMGFSESMATSQKQALDWEADPNALERHRRVYQAWFDANCPRFECDDPYVTRLYWYRWFIARHCLSRAMTGLLQDPYFFEGTRESHFPRLVAFSSPHIIAETRWLRDGQYAFGQIRNHCRTANSTNHFFISSRIDSKFGEYNNWITKAAWEYFWVHPSRDRLKEVIASMAGDVLGTLREFDQDDDALPTPKSHGKTGMEFQPSFFYFNPNYDNTLPDARLERADFAAYLYGNARAVAEAYQFLNISDEAERFRRLAERIQDACLRKMWDEKDRFLYAVREDDDAVARVREIVGFYPFMTRLMPDEPRYTSALAYLTDPREFWTPYPPSTTSRTCPAYSPAISTWPAAGGRTHGSMWNGQYWPHATSIMLDVAAAAIQDYHQRAITPAHFWHIFDRYTRIQFENDDLNRPMTREHYNNETAQPEGIPDYFHSTYADLVIKYLVGLQPSNRDDRVVIRSIPGPFRSFRLSGVLYRGHELDIVYNASGGSTAGPTGLTVWLDGKMVAHGGTLKPMTVAIPRPVVVKQTQRKVNIYGEEIESP